MCSRSKSSIAAVCVSPRSSSGPLATVSVKQAESLSGKRVPHRRAAYATGVIAVARAARL